MHLRRLESHIIIVPLLLVLPADTWPSTEQLFLCLLPFLPSLLGCNHPVHEDNELIIPNIQYFLNTLINHQCACEKIAVVGMYLRLDVAMLDATSFIYELQHAV